MLSMAEVKSAKAASHYYEKDDYYLPSKDGGSALDLDADGSVEAGVASHEGHGDARGGGGAGGDGGGSTRASSGTNGSANGEPAHSMSRREHEGEWWGKGAASLGLEGNVKGDDFRNMLEGQLPNGTVLGTIKDGERVHRAGWDLTFSAPKSVSILYEVGGDERVLQAHQDAVKEALAWMEENQSTNRERTFIGRINVNTNKLAVALFQHDTSRKQDPNLHTHAVVMNATERADGKWVSLDSKPLFDAKMASGAIYRAALAERLPELGYEIERTGRDGSFEAKAIPEPLIHHWSKRSQEIREAMQERGLEGAVGAAKAALRTRGRKEKMPRELLRPAWQAESKQVGTDVEAIVNDARERGPVQSNDMFDLDRLVREVIQSLSEREAAFPRERLVQLAMQAAVGHSNIHEIERAIERAEQGKRIEATIKDGRHTYVTPKAAMRESLILKTFRESKGTVDAIAVAESVDRRLDASILRDSPMQRAAAKLVLTSKDRFVGIVGRAGTGKTTLLTIVNEVASDADYRLKGMAQNSDAAKVLENETKIRSGTLKSHLIQASRDELVLRDKSLLNVLERRAIEAKYSKEVWVLDEGSQVGSKDMRRMMFLADRLGARVVSIFDPHQLAAIEQGKPAIQLLNAGLPHVKLEDIRRQHHAHHRDAIGEVYKGAPDKALSMLASEMRLVEKPEDRLNAMIAEYRSRVPEMRESSLLATSTNQAKTFLNEGVRNVLREEGAIKNEQHRVVLGRVDHSYMDRRDASFYKEGYVVRFVSGVRGREINRGDYFQVRAVNKDTNELTLERLEGESKDRLLWNPRVEAPAKSQEILAPRATTLAPGEPIRWTRPDAKLGLTNGQFMIVETADHESTVVRKSDGSLLALNTDDPSHRHWDHAYATTFASSQGKTASHSIVNVGSDQAASLSMKTFLVGISRHRETTVLFMDDPDKVAANVKRHLGDKTSALEERDNTRWSSATKEIDRLLRDGKQFVSQTPVAQKPLER